MKDTIAQRFEAQRQAIRARLRTSGAALAYLFGSVASETERADSDLDLAVLFGREIPAQRYGEIRVSLLTQLVGLTHTNDIDLIVLNDAPPLLAVHIISTGRLFLGNHRDQVCFETEAIKRYVDTRRLREYVAAGFMNAVSSKRPDEHESTGQW